MSRKGSNPWGWVLGIGAALGVGALLWSKTNQKTDKIDEVVSWLNNKFGHNWFSVGLAVLSRAMPPPMQVLVGVLGAVYKAEELGRQQNWTGPQKHQYACANC